MDRWRALDEEVGRRSRGGSARLTSALRRHGIGRAAIASVWTMGGQLVGATAQEMREFAATIDSQTGQSIGVTLRGDVDEVDLSAHLAEMREGHRYVQVHTHPHSAAPSDADIAMLLRHPALAATIVLTRNGSAHIVSKRPTHTPALVLAAVVEWNRVHDALFESYRRAVSVGQLTEDEATRRHTHRVVRAVARRFGLLYTRTEEVF